jgi:hypothetical protein
MSVGEVRESLLNACAATETAISRQTVVATGLDNIGRAAAALQTHIRELSALTGGFLNEYDENIAGQTSAIDDLKVAIRSASTTAEGTHRLDDPLTLLRGSVGSASMTLQETTAVGDIIRGVYAETVNIDISLGDLATRVTRLSEGIYDRIDVTSQARNDVEAFVETL